MTNGVRQAAIEHTSEHSSRQRSQVQTQKTAPPNGNVEVQHQIFPPLGFKSSFFYNLKGSVKAPGYLALKERIDLLRLSEPRVSWRRAMHAAVHRMQPYAPANASGS